MMPVATRILNRIVPHARRIGLTLLRVRICGPIRGKTGDKLTEHRSLYRLGLRLLLFVSVFGLTLNLLADDEVRLRDLVMIAGARDNQLVGFGLVAGLAGDGDKDPIYTQQTIANMLQRYGINVQPQLAQISAKNVAVVMVTADIAAFVKPGARIDVQVSSMGDAKSLQGGVLLQTALLGADNKVYAVAQGPMTIGGFSVGTSGAGGANVTKESSHGGPNFRRGDR